jgi:hypothetical protein
MTSPYDFSLPSLSFIFPSGIAACSVLKIIISPTRPLAENKDHTLIIITPRCPFDGIPGEINHRRMIITISVSLREKSTAGCL